MNSVAATLHAYYSYCYHVIDSEQSAHSSSVITGSIVAKVIKLKMQANRLQTGHSI